VRPPRIQDGTEPQEFVKVVVERFVQKLQGPTELEGVEFARRK
jgi:hypothetical protein